MPDIALCDALETFARGIRPANAGRAAGAAT